MGVLTITVVIQTAKMKRFFERGQKIPFNLTGKGNGLCKPKV